MKKLIVIFLLMLCTTFILCILGVHRKTNLYTPEKIQESILEPDEDQRNDDNADFQDNTESVVEEAISEEAISEEEAAMNDDNLIIEIDSNKLKDAFENVGYSTNTIPGGKSFYQSVSSNEDITISYDIEAIKSIEIRYKFTETSGLTNITEDSELVKAWTMIAYEAMGDKETDEFIDFVKQYEELNGMSYVIGNLSMYSQVYGGEFFVYIQKNMN